MNDNWQAASPILVNHGYCVFAFNYGGSSPNADFQGTGEIAASAGQLASFVTQVLAATGASKVDIVGHSQGGMMPRYYLKFLGGVAYVSTLVGLAPSNHGYTVIESRNDEVVTPYTSAFLSGPGVTDITVQNQCPLDQSDHLELAYDPVAMADMLNALDPASPVSVPCVPVLPVTGPVGPVPPF